MGSSHNLLRGEVMDLSMNNVFSVVKGDKTYSFVVPHGAPYGEAIDSCFQVLAKLSEMQKAAIDAIKPAAAEEEKAEEVVAQVAN